MSAPVIEPTNGRGAVGRHFEKGSDPVGGLTLGCQLGLLLVGAGLRRLVPLLLRHLLVLAGAVFRRPRTLLGSTFLTHRSVPSDVARRLLAAAQQLVQESHVFLRAR